MSGRNWGDAVIDGSTLVFNVAGKPAFRIPLTDVGQVCVTQYTTSYCHNMHCRELLVITTQCCSYALLLTSCSAASLGKAAFPVCSTGPEGEGRCDAGVSC